MAQQLINIGSAPNDHTGDPLRTAGSKINGNFTELYGLVSSQPSAVTDVTGTTYTFALGDANGTKRFTSATAVSATVPPNASAAFPIGSQIACIQYGAGLLTFIEGAGVTVRKPPTKALSIAEQYGSAVLQKVATNEWLLAGYLTTP